jgi:hypothetical protein
MVLTRESVEAATRLLGNMSSAAGSALLDCRPVQGLPSFYRLVRRRLGMSLSLLGVVDAFNAR